MIHEIRITQNNDHSYRLDPRDENGKAAGRAITSVLGYNMDQAIMDLFENGPIAEPEWYEA